MDGTPPLIKPPRLREGDTVCVVSLSSGAAAALPKRLEQGMRQLAEAFELRVVEAPPRGGALTGARGQLSRPRPSATSPKD